MVLVSVRFRLFSVSFVLCSVVVVILFHVGFVRVWFRFGLFSVCFRCCFGFGLFSVSVRFGFDSDSYRSDAIVQ